MAASREDKFARHVFEGKTQSEAYRIVYPHSKKWKPEAVHVCASKLAAKVRLRIQRMQDEANERALNKALLTLEDHMDKLRELRDLAAASETFAPAITAEVKRGELMGYYVARSETVNTNFVISGSPESDDADADPEEWTARNRPN